LEDVVLGGSIAGPGVEDFSASAFGFFLSVVVPLEGLDERASEPETDREDCGDPEGGACE
jgi:hypothetical protein